MAAVAYDPTFARIDHVVRTFGALRQPGRPIPADVTRLTGIADRDVAGHAIDADEVRAFVAGADVVVAHNAAFDRPVVERAWPFFADVPWACSLTQVDWRAEGFEGRKLGQLLCERRRLFDGHRALDDVLALVHLLQQPLTLGTTGFALIMVEASRVTVRVWATNAPYDRRALLKSRGYRWANGEGRAPRAWSRDMPEPMADAEVSTCASTSTTTQRRRPPAAGSPPSTASPRAPTRRAAEGAPMRTILLPDLVGDRAWVAPAAIGYVEPGWAHVVVDMLDALGRIIAGSPDTMVDVLNLAERDGALVCDVVVDPRPDPTVDGAVRDAIAAAVSRSSATCARCGAPGRLRLDRPAWPTTRCDEHASRGRGA